MGSSCSATGHSEVKEEEATVVDEKADLLVPSQTVRQVEGRHKQQAEVDRDAPLVELMIPPAQNTAPAVSSQAGSGSSDHRHSLSRLMRPVASHESSTAHGNRNALHSHQVPSEGGSSVTSCQGRRVSLAGLGPLAVNTSAFSLDSGKISATERQALDAQFAAERMQQIAPPCPPEDWGTNDRRRIMMANFYGISAAELTAAQNRSELDLLYTLEQATDDGA